MVDVLSAIDCATFGAILLVAPDLPVSVSAFSGSVRQRQLFSNHIS